MKKKLELKVTFPFWLAYAANLQIIRWSPMQLASSAIFPAAGLFLSYLWFKNQHTLSFSDVLLLIGCFFFTPLILVMTLFLVRRRNPLAKGPFNFVFDDDGLHASNPAFDMSLKWAAIQKVRESRTFIFFFVAPSRAQSIPLAQLRSAGILEEVHDLVLQRVKDVKLCNIQHVPSVGT